MGRTNYLGIYNTLVQEFQTEDRFEYSKFVRMLPENFEELLYLITKSIEKKRTVICDPIPARVKLAAKYTSHDSTKMHRTIEFTYFNRKTRHFKMMKFKHV